ncbi:MAG: hypothetical protein RMH97_10255 [Verrucomicrobiales bacterium]|nr:hypothetical protein [Verrucomicrobiales bacterium]
MCSPGGAVVIYTNDFEAYSEVATNWNDYIDADPTGPEWKIIDDETYNPPNPPERNTAGIQVINWAARSGTKALLCRTATEAQIHFPTPLSGSRYVFDFWLLVARGTSSDRNFYLILRGEGADHNGDDFIAYRSSRNTNDWTIWYYDGVANPNTAGAWVNTGYSSPEMQWQHHRMVIRPNELKMDLYLDDMETPALTNIDLARCEIAVPTMLRIVNEANTWDDGIFIIDDISLTVEGAVDLTTPFTEGFEAYPARQAPSDDADPGGPWITVETDGVGTSGATYARALAPTKVQVVDSNVVMPRSGSKCLKLEGGQRAGVSFAWGAPPQADVEITWWARVPEAVQSSPTADAVLLRMSCYGAENDNMLAGDNALLGYGIKRQGGTNCGDGTALLYYAGAAWQDSGRDYTPGVWEEYRLITHTAQGLYTIIKNPSSANPQIVVDRAPMIGSGITKWTPVFMAAWSSSNGTNHPPVYIDDIRIRSLTSIPNPLPQPYTVTNYGSRFTNVTVLPLPGRVVGKPAVDPRDKSILFAIDEPAGGIYRAQKVASGNWVIDPTPIVSGLELPSGLIVRTNGDLWWTHDYNVDNSRSVGRLKWPWSSNLPETIIADIFRIPSPPEPDDDAIDLCVAPETFAGSLGQAGWLVVADRGVDGNAFNALYLVDPETTNLYQRVVPTYLVQPTASDLGGDIVGIDSLPQSGEVVVVTSDGFVVAVNGDGALRYITTQNLWPIGAPANGAAVAVDPLRGRIWVADNRLDEVWSVDSSTGEDQREIGFPLTNPSRPDQQINLHDPGMAFAPDGSFMVLSDCSTGNGGGRVLVFHNEPFVIPDFAVTNVAVRSGAVTLAWSSAGAVNYSVLRGTDVAAPASFNIIATNLQMTVYSFTDTNPPVGGAFYRVVALPDPLTRPLVNP